MVPKGRKMVPKDVKMVPKDVKMVPKGWKMVPPGVPKWCHKAVKKFKIDGLDMHFLGVETFKQSLSVLLCFFQLFFQLIF